MWNARPFKGLLYNSEIKADKWKKTTLHRKPEGGGGVKEKKKEKMEELPLFVHIALKEIHIQHTNKENGQQLAKVSFSCDEKNMKKLQWHFQIKFMSH